MSDGRPDRSVSPDDPSRLRCDTCGQPTTRVSRVVIDRGYDRSNARPLWNCPDCFEKKNRDRVMSDE